MTSKTLQTVLIPKKDYSLEQAEAKIKEMGYKTHFYKKKVDITENFYRFRQASPKKFKKDGYTTETLKNNIQLVYGTLKD